MYRRSLPLALALLPMAFVLPVSPVGAEPVARHAWETSDWVEPMKKVHSRFQGDKSTFAHFGDSITVTMAFWAPLAGQPKNVPPEMARALERVKAYMKPECWNRWKGAEFGNTGSMTIRWAHENADQWLRKLNPAVVLLMFGTNDLGQLSLKEYEAKTRAVVRRCLEKGTVLILTTPPPRSGLLKESGQFAVAVRRIAREEKVPLIDYFGEIVKRRPDDWDGALPKFKDTPGDEYQVPTLIARDGVHPSHPAKFLEYSKEGLRNNGYVLRNYLTVLAYAEVIGKVLQPPAPKKGGDLHRSVTFYASFDEAVRGDFGRGTRSLSTRFNHPTDKNQYVFEKGFDGNVFRVARDKGIAGGALEATAVLPRNGRIFFPAKDNIAFKKGGWGGALSVWINTDPNKLLKTKFCDPVQITQKGATNGGIWFDFNDARPRDLRLGVFPAVAEGQKPIGESDPKAPMVRVPKVAFKAGEWHHVVLTWQNFDTGKADGQAVLYIDGKRIGEVKDYPIAMDWDLENAGIYVAVNYIGLLDELAIFNRPLTAPEIGRLHREPGLLTKLKGAGR